MGTTEFRLGTREGLIPAHAPPGESERHLPSRFQVRLLRKNTAARRLSVVGPALALLSGSSEAEAEAAALRGSVLGLPGACARSSGSGVCSGA